MVRPRLDRTRDKTGAAVVKGRRYGAAAADGICAAQAAAWERQAARSASVAGAVRPARCWVIVAAELLAGAPKRAVERSSGGVGGGGLPGDALQGTVA
jgi:hypothetical protein